MRERLIRFALCLAATGGFYTVTVWFRMHEMWALFILGCALMLKWAFIAADILTPPTSGEEGRS